MVTAKINNQPAGINVTWGQGAGAVTQTTDLLPFLGYGNQVWEETSFDFFATAINERLTFSSIAEMGSISYMAIDGIRVTYIDNSNSAPVAADDGNALNEFKEMCIRQGVDIEVISQLIDEPWSVLDRAPMSIDIIARNSGYISQINALIIGEVLCKLGAGRTGENPDIDHGVGAELLVEIGDEIIAGEAWIRFDTREEMSDEMVETIQNSLSLSETKPIESSRILEIIEK